MAISTPLWAMLGRNLNKKMVYYCACAVVGAVVLGMLIVQPGIYSDSSMPSCFPIQC